MAFLDVLSPLCTQKPSAKAWKAVCASLDTAADAEVTTYLPQLQDLLSPWKDTLRVAPRAWIDKLFAGKSEPRMQLARRCSLQFHMSRANFLALIRAPDIGHITHLNTNVTRPRIDTSCMVALAQSPMMQNLKVLRLGIVPLFKVGAQAFAQSPYLTNLVHLEILHGKLGDGGLEALSQATFPKLEVLDLWNTGASASAIKGLFEAPLMAQLQSLRIGAHYKTGLSAACFKALAVSPRLTSLALGLNALKDKEVSRLVQHATLAGLKSLDLSNNPIGPEALEALAASPHLPKLRTLDVGDTNCHQKHASLLDVPNLPSLVSVRWQRRGPMIKIR